VVLIAGRQHTADYSDAECPSDLESHGIGSRPDPRVALGTDPTTEFVAVGNNMPAPRPMSKSQAARSIRRRKRGDGGYLPQAARDRCHPGGYDDLDPDDASEDRRQHSAHHQHGGQG